MRDIVCLELWLNRIANRSYGDFELELLKLYTWRGGDIYIDENATVCAKNWREARKILESENVSPEIIAGYEYFESVKNIKVMMSQEGYKNDPILYINWINLCKGYLTAYDLGLT